MVISLRLPKSDTILLMAYIVRVRDGEKPGIYSNKMFKKVYKHPNFDKLVSILNEIKYLEASI